MMKRNIAIVIVIVLLIFGGSVFENLYAVGFEIEPLETPLETSEGGDMAIFWVSLTNPPDCQISCFAQVNVSSSNPNEGQIISPPSYNLFFDTNNTQQQVTVKGINDNFPDGNQVYFIKLRGVGPYQDLTEDVSITNIDDEGPYTPPPEAFLAGNLILDEGQEGTYLAQESYPPNVIVSFQWDWEYDGLNFKPSPDTDMNETHIWLDHGNYIVAVRITDFLGYRDIATLEVTVNDLGPLADFGWRQGAPEEGDIVNFEDSSTSYPDNIDVYIWDFSGLGTSNAMNPDFTFTSDGNYTVTLIVIDEDNTEDTISKVINVEDKDPVPNFSASPLTGKAPLTINFTDESYSYDGIDTYSWDFGDGNTSTGSTSPTYTYSAVGTYTVSLTVTEPDGDMYTAIKSHYITVRCTNNDECLTGDYCQKTIGDCDGQGECTDRPTACSGEWDPVCGCDGETYPNACKAAEVGINISYIGECRDIQAFNLNIDPNKMKIISFVHYPDDANALSVFGDEVRQKYYQYEALFKIGTYNPEIGDYIEYGGNLIIKPGSGYWCYARYGLNISFNGVPINPDDNIKVELLFDSNTTDGWNMIACPHNTNYLWDNVHVSGCDPSDPNAKTISQLAIENDCNCIDRRLWKWKNETYVYYDPDPNSTCGNEPEGYERDSNPYMRPNEGYWVKVKKEDVYLSFPPLNMPRVKESHPDILISDDMTSPEERSPSAPKRPTAAAVSDSPPAPLGGFRSDGDGFLETGSGGCFINNILFGLPRHTP
ncbi:MAG: PKD domain-containing protein [bacterium]